MPREVPRGSRRAPRLANGAPRGPQDGPGQLASKCVCFPWLSRICPERSQEAPEGPQDWRTGLREGPKTAQDSLPASAF
eukprot:3184805-Pyramimonas_sp.AAC.1